jgi:formylglycine-generating enzyme required for sulfatase activity
MSHWLETFMRAVAVAALCTCLSCFAASASNAVTSSFKDCSDCPEMIVIPPGVFDLGSSTEEANRDLQSVPLLERSMAKSSVEREHPQHSVTIERSFGLAKYPVTRDEFSAFIEATQYQPARTCTLFANYRFSRRDGAAWDNPGFAQGGRDPVVCVSWQDANAYVAWLNKIKGNGADNELSGGFYRLPSEAEWEFAARAGTRTARWWGDAIDVDNADCDGCGSQWDKSRTAPVDSFAPNPLGLLQMLGGVWQLTQDCWHENYVGAPSDGSAWLGGDCTAHVMRGGSWSSDA